jgi:hypothetical protein
VVWQGHKVGLFLVFKGTSILISTVVSLVSLVYIPPTVYEGSFFFASSLVFVVVSFSDDCHSDWGQMKF